MLSPCSPLYAQEKGTSRTMEEYLQRPQMVCYQLNIMHDQIKRGVFVFMYLIVAIIHCTDILCYSGSNYRLISITMHCCCLRKKSFDHCAISQKLSARTEEDSAVQNRALFPIICQSALLRGPQSTQGTKYKQEHM